jgi:hypothetical protein
VQETKDCLLDCLVVELPGGPSRAREQRSLPAILERPEVLAVGVLIDPKKVAHHAAAQATAARENDHGSVTVGQSAAIEAVKQGRDVGDIADLLAKRIGADLLLENGTHPLERGLTGLLAFVGLRGDVDHPTGIAEKLLRAASRNDRRISTG